MGKRPRHVPKRKKLPWPEGWPRHVRVNAAPPANASDEAIVLREAAIAFGKLTEPVDADDIRGQKANWRLLAAAVSYARKAG